MRLTLASRSYDLSTRALVMGVLGAPEELAEQGADLVELSAPDSSSPVPVCVVASDDATVESAVTGAAALVRLPAPTGTQLRRCAAGGVTVIVPSAAVADALEAGMPLDRVVSDALLLDVTAEHCPAAAAAVGVIRGARIVRTADVRGAQRVCDVLAAVLEAR